MGEMIVAVVGQHDNVSRAQLRDELQCQREVAVEGLGWREQLAEHHGIDIAKALEHRAPIRTRAEIGHFALHTGARQCRSRAGHAIAHRCDGGSKAIRRTLDRSKTNPRDAQSAQPLIAGESGQPRIRS